MLNGVLLAVVAAFVTRQSRDLLIGEGIQPETLRAIRSMALAIPPVRDVGRILSMHMGPDDALVTMGLDFDESTAAADAGLAIATLEQQARERFPMIKRLFITSGRAAGRAGARPHGGAVHREDPRGVSIARADDHRESDVAHPLGHVAANALPSVTQRSASG